jgi:hypothetical protein
MAENNAPGITPSAPGLSVTAEQTRAQLMKIINGRGNWFYWIAGLSVINTIMAISNTSYNFVVGLGATQFIDAVAAVTIKDIGSESAAMVRLVNIGLDLAIIGLFIFLGIKATRARAWAFITGIVLYTLDTLLFLLNQDWFAIAFHVFVLVMLFIGLQHVNKLKKLDAAQPEAIPVIS